MEHFFLNEENVGNLVGKEITWTAEGNDKRYHGKDIVKSVDFSKRNPIETEVVSGDNLAFAYLENFGLKREGNAYRTDANAPRAFTYTDDYREVEVISVED